MDTTYTGFSERTSGYSFDGYDGEMGFDRFPITESIDQMYYAEFGPNDKGEGFEIFSTATKRAALIQLGFDVRARGPLSAEMDKRFHEVAKDSVTEVKRAALTHWGFNANHMTSQLNEEFEKRNWR